MSERDYIPCSKTGELIPALPPVEDPGPNVAAAAAEGSEDETDRARREAAWLALRAELEEVNATAKQRAWRATLQSNFAAFLAKQEGSDG